MNPSLDRVVVVGSSCSGKTTFSKRLAATLGHPHIELDALNWLQDWVERPEEFRKPTEAERFLRPAFRVIC